MDPLTLTCPVCSAKPTDPCRALDHAALPTPHPERMPLEGPTPTFDGQLASMLLARAESALVDLITLANLGGFTASLPVVSWDEVVEAYGPASVLAVES